MANLVGRTPSSPVDKILDTFLKALKVRAGEKTLEIQELVVNAHLRGAWDSACDRAGLPELQFHDLRRSGVRNL